MGKFKDSFGGTVAGATVNTGLGLLLQKHNDKRQLEQNKKLLDQQLSADLIKMGAQKQADLEMWKNTSYPAQIEMMKKAGVNPSLMYGMGGGGGTTVGNSGGGVSGANAPMGGGEIMGMMLQKAQMDLIKAQTEKTKVEAGKIGGVDTEESKARIVNLTQDVKNKEAVKTLTDIQSKISNLELALKEDTYDEVLDQIRWTSETARENLILTKYRRELEGATVKDKIKIVQGELIGIGLENELKKSGISLNTQQIENMKASIAQGWKKLDIDAQNALANIMSANANKQNADTNLRNFFQRINEFEIDHRLKTQIQGFAEHINNVTESDKIMTDGFFKILQAIGIGGALKGSGRVEIKGFR